MRLSLIFLLATFVAWPVATPVAEPIAVESRPVPLNPEDREQVRVGALRYLGGLRLRSDDPRFGGLSGLMATPSGRMIAVSDRGRWLTFRTIEDGQGRLTGIADATMAPLLDLAGDPVAGVLTDAEAVEAGPSGEILVSFERRHRIWRYDVRGGLAQARPSPLDLPAAVGQAPRNGGLEAIAPLGRGELLIVTEDLAAPDGGHAAWLLRFGGATRLSLRRAGRFKPTDLSPLPNGDLLLLERSFTRLLGPAARISRISRSALEAGGDVVPQPLAILSLPLGVDNFEGLATVPAPGGGQWIYVLSDDNFNHLLQRTLLLKFLWPGG